MEVPDGGLVSVCRTTEGLFLCHSVTRERRRLPDSSLSALIATNGASQTVVTLDGVAQWANDLLHVGLAQIDDGQLVVLSGDRAAPLQDYLWAHERIHLPVAFAGKEILLTVYKCAQTQVDGGRLWWGLSLLWQAMQVQYLKAHQWLSNWVRWWRRRFDKLGLDPTHLRPSCVARDGSATQVDGDNHGGCDLGVSDRCLPELSCSTLGLLLLLVSRFAKGGHKKKKTDVASVWASLCRSLSRECLPATFVIGLSADQAFAIKTDSSSEPTMVIQCEGEGAQLDRLAGHSSRFACRLKAVAATGSISIFDLAMHFDTAKDSHFLLQLLWQVAGAMEQRILGSASQDGVVQLSRDARS